MSVACRGMQRLAPSDDLGGNVSGRGSAQSDDTYPAPPRRRCNGHNGVVGREHADTRSASLTRRPPFTVWLK